MRSTKKLNTKDFIERATKVHGNKYDYSKVKYINDYTKVEIICPVHGSFWQLPGSHTRQKSGCWECSYLTRVIDRPKRKPDISKEEFVKNAVKIHGDRYDYSKVKYINCSTKVEIICPVHGSFWQQPAGHVNEKWGCNECRKINSRKKVDCFIKEAKEIHNDKYDYSKVDYINNKIKVEIICQVHGSFWQRPANHISSKTGCPKCKKSFGERKVEKFLLSNNINFVEQKRFDKCKNANTLPFDFYLPDFNLLIEYDGRQHFEVIEHFGGEKRLTETKKRDIIKSRFAKDNGFVLLRINHKEYKNIEKILERII